MQVTVCYKPGCEPASRAVRASNSLLQAPQDRVGQARPRFDRPVAEGAVGQAGERDPRFGVDPEERAAAAEVAIRARRVLRPGPVRRLAVAQLEAEPPVVRILPAEAGQDAGEPGELHG